MTGTDEDTEKSNIDECSFVLNITISTYLDNTLAVSEIVSPLFSCMSFEFITIDLPPN